MSMKKPAVLLAFVGACALVFTGPASVASPLRADPVPAEDTPASSLPVGDLDTALTSKDGQAPEVAEVVDRDSVRLVGVIVQLEEGIDRSAALASMNEAVAASFPGVQVRVEREYANVLDGFALSAPPAAWRRFAVWRGSRRPSWSARGTSVVWPPLTRRAAPGPRRSRGRIPQT